MLDSVVSKDNDRGEPKEGAHRKLVAVSLVGSELPTKVDERIEGVSIVESFLVFSVTAFDFAIMSGCVGTDELVADAQMDSGGFKQSRKITLAVRKTVGKLKTVVRLNTFDLDAASGIPCHGFLQEVCGRIRALFRISTEIPQPGEFIDRCVLIQTQIRISDTSARNNLHVDLYPLPRMGHLLVWLGHVLLFLLRCRKHI